MNTRHDDFADTIFMPLAVQPIHRPSRRPTATPRYSPRSKVLAGMLLALQSTALVLGAVHVLSLA